MSTWIETEKNSFDLSSPLDSTPTDTKTILDSLSHLDVRDLLNKSAFLPPSSHDHDALHALQTYIKSYNHTTATAAAFSSLPTPSSPVYFPKSQLQLQKFVHSSHLFLFDVMTHLPLYHLQPLPSFSIWRSESSNTLDPDLPQSYITQIGEHLLALVQALEPFATQNYNEHDSSSLDHIMDGVKHNISIAYWKEFLDFLFHTGSSSPDQEQRLRTVLLDKDTTIHKIMDAGSNALSVTKEEESDEEEEEPPHVQFCNEWLDIIATALTGRILERICRLQRLTNVGYRHLKSDLNYLANVLMALGIHGHPHPFLMMIGEEGEEEQKWDDEDVETVGKLLKKRIKSIRV